ncbi:MAG: hypothetical protein ABFD86_03210 [Bryobacteraceae bacterium]
MSLARDMPSQASRTALPQFMACHKPGSSVIVVTHFGPVHFAHAMAAVPSLAPPFALQKVE